MITVIELITDSMRKLGVLSRGEVPSSEEASDILRDLNRMLGFWNNQNLMVQGIVIEEFSLVSGNDTYTMGVGGDFDTSAPLKIEAAFLKYDDSYQTPVRIVDSQEWGNLQNNIVESSMPTHVYIDKNYPLQAVRFYPTPSESKKVIFHNYRKFSKFTSLTQEINLADGYELALVSNLALFIAPDFGKSPSEFLYKAANDAITVIKRTNTQNRKLKVDTALLCEYGDIIGGFN